MDGDSGAAGAAPRSAWLPMADLTPRLAASETAPYGCVEGGSASSSASSAASPPSATLDKMETAALLMSLAGTPNLSSAAHCGSASDSLVSTARSPRLFTSAPASAVIVDGHMTTSSPPHVATTCKGASALPVQPKREHDDSGASPAKARPSKRIRVIADNAIATDDRNDPTIDPLTAKADSLQAFLNQEVAKALTDFKLLLERTMKAENEVHSSTQYTTQDVRIALAARMEAAASKLETELRPKTGDAHGKARQSQAKGRKLKRNELHTACVNGTIDAVRVIAEASNVNEPSLDGFYPLFLAVKHKHGEVVDFLLKLGADPCAVNGSQGLPALHQAVKSNSIDIVKLLIRHGASREQENKAGLSVFDLKINLSMWSALRNTPGPSDQFEPLSPRVGTMPASADSPADKGSQPAPLLRTPAGSSEMSRIGLSAPGKRMSQNPKVVAEPRQVRKLFKAEHGMSGEPTFGDVPTFDVTTEFFLGKSANDALQLPGRGRLWGKHKDIFRHTCTKAEKQYLLSHSGAPKTVGLKATLVLASQIRQLAKNHPHYKDNTQIQDNVAKLTAFTLNNETLHSVRGEVKTITSDTSRTIGISAATVPSDSDGTPVSAVIQKGEGSNVLES
mmetsp:Transcript_24150/g.63016  ORF Transcript_24150/g.63016 Transcript_24150/m.63016 type:complete len:621 (+) Transcript_24150:263-2125(+)